MKCRNEVRVEQKVPIAVAVKGRLEVVLNVFDHGLEKRSSVWVRTTVEREKRRNLTVDTTMMLGRFHWAVRA